MVSKEKPKNLSSNVQDRLLDVALRKSVGINIIFKNKNRVLGNVKTFDSYTILLVDDKGQNLIFKQSIASINLARNFKKPPYNNSFRTSLLMKQIKKNGSGGNSQEKE